MLHCLSCKERVLPRERFCKFCGAELPAVRVGKPTLSGSGAFSLRRLMPSGQQRLEARRWELLLEGRRHIVRLVGGGDVVGVSVLTTHSILLDGSLRHVHRGRLTPFSCGFDVSARRVVVEVSQREGCVVDGAGQWQAECTVDGKAAARWAPHKQGSCMFFSYPQRGAPSAAVFALEFEEASGLLFIDGALARDVCEFVGKDELPPEATEGAVAHAFDLPVAPPLSAAGAACRLVRWQSAGDGAQNFVLTIGGETVRLEMGTGSGAQGSSCSNNGDSGGHQRRRRGGALPESPSQSAVCRIS